MTWPFNGLHAATVSRERNSAHIWWQALNVWRFLDGSNSHSLANGTPLVSSAEFVAPQRTSAVFWASALPKLGPASPKLWLSIYIVHFNVTASYTPSNHSFEFLPHAACLLLALSTCLRLKHATITLNRRHNKAPDLHLLPTG